MAVSLRDVMSFFVVFEKTLYQSAPQGIMESRIREVEKLLKLFEAYSNCKFVPLQLDFSSPENPAHLSEAEAASPQVIWSLVLNYGNLAHVVVNDMMRPGTTVRLVNHCYRRFLAMKEAYHVVLREEFIKLGLTHPDTNTPERLVTLAEELTFLPFSIVDFDSPEYPDVVKVENAAELLAFLTLYPIQVIDADRKKFRAATGEAKFEDPTVIVSSTLEFAEERKVPRRYVDLLFRWHRFDELYAMYRQLCDGYSAI